MKNFTRVSNKIYFCCCYLRFLGFNLKFYFYHVQILECTTKRYKVIKKKKCFVSYILTTKKFEVNVNEFLVLYSKSLINVVSPFKYKKID